MSLNATLPPLPSYTLKPVPPLISGLPDQYLNALLLPVTYWVISGIFHVIDVWDLFPQYRLHTPAEILNRNHATRWEVFRDVLVQQFVQAIVGVGLGVFEPDQVMGREDYDTAVWARRIRIAQGAVPKILAVVGVDAHGIASNLVDSQPIVASILAGGKYSLAQETAIGLVPAFASWEMTLAKAIYWVLIPAIQFVVAALVLDAWQYFVHRGMHVNKWLYNKFHSRHHRLYVPYAYGALYNHPVEGFIMDTIGAAVAYILSGLTARQGMCFFNFCTLKTVDDHCGYALPWDPLQHITANNAAYHDVHHQSWGIKTNFSQPFFTVWDGMLGTMWKGGDVSLRYERARVAAERAMNKPITGPSPAESTKADTIAPYEADVKAADAETRKLNEESLPQAPAGKATAQALSSRHQVLEDPQNGGASVLREETAEEKEAQIEQQRMLRRSPRKKSTGLASTPTAGLKGLRDRVNESLHGRGSGVLGMESSR